MRMLYGYIFNKEVCKIVPDEDEFSKFDIYDDVIFKLNEIYSTDEFFFGPLDKKDKQNYIYGAIEITSDIEKDADDNFFSVDLDQVSEYTDRLLAFIDNNPELGEVSYSTSPRLFFLPN